MAGTKPEKTREQRERSEFLRTKKILAGLDKDLAKLLEPLLKNAAFMAVQLEDYRENIRENGGVCEYQNGENQWGTKKSPEAELYNTMMKNYQAVIRQLFDLSPEGAGGDNAALIAFFSQTAAARRRDK